MTNRKGNLNRTVAVRLPDSLYKRLKEKAQKDERSVSQTVKRILRQML